MSNFKQKNSKKIIEEHRITLDAKHQKKIQNYEKLKEEIPNIDKEISKCKKDIKSLKETQSFMKFQEIHDLELKIKELKKKKRRIMKNKDLNKYLLKSGKLMFDYYESMDSQTNNMQQKVNNFFNINSQQDVNIVNEKEKITEKYDELNENSYKNKNFVKDLKTYYLCPECKTDLKIINQEALLFCEECGYSRPMIIDMIKPSYKDPPKEAAYFNYKRINHFNEWLAQFQAKETTEIPKNVYHEILLELKKQRIQNMALLNQSKLRQILKKLNLNKYYEHIPHIINRLNGIPPPKMSREKEETLRNMFKEIQLPFIKHCPADRKNFLSYSYVLHKFCQLLELDEYLSYFPLLKSREKLYDMDQIWKKICKELSWEFIPSI
jgi:DNA-directed RNA polymerase subunit RPC12/RpoP